MLRLANWHLQRASTSDMRLCCKVVLTRFVAVSGRGVHWQRLPGIARRVQVRRSVLGDQPDAVERGGRVLVEGAGTVLSGAGCSDATCSTPIDAGISGLTGTNMLGERPTFIRQSTLFSLQAIRDFRQLCPQAVPAESQQPIVESVTVGEDTITTLNHARMSSAAPDITVWLQTSIWWQTLPSNSSQS